MNKPNEKHESKYAKKCKERGAGRWMIDRKTVTIRATGKEVNVPKSCPPIDGELH